LNKKGVVLYPNGIVGEFRREWSLKGRHFQK